MKKTKPASWFVTIPLVVLTAVYVGLGFLPAEKAIAAMGKELREKQQFCTLAGDLVPALETTQQRLAKTRQFTKTWTETAPKRPEVSALLGTIHTLLQTSGSRTTRFDPEPLVPHERIAELPVIVGCTGTFQQVYKFLHDLESLPATVWVREFEIKKAGENGKNVACEVKMAIFMDNSAISD